MNDITDHGIVLDLRPHGEHHAIVHVLSAAHGRMAGFVFGGQGRRQQANVQLGNLVDFTCVMKNYGQLGTMQLELVHNPSANVLHDQVRLAALQFLCPLLARVLPEGHPYPHLFNACREFFREFHMLDWPQRYVQLELQLLAELGYGLDFTQCALTGERDAARLAYVSPKTGRAATAEASRGYERSLLPLPQFLVSAAVAAMDDIRAGLNLTGYFLQRHMDDYQNRVLWQFRQRLFNHFQNQMAA